MCGITGIFAFTQQGHSIQHKINAAVNTIISRGPDHNNTFTHNNVSLGHVRLSIIDTSPEANQPFTDHTGRYTIVYNGEIYNHRELRQQLIHKNKIAFKMAEWRKRWSKIKSQLLRFQRLRSQRLRSQRLQSQRLQSQLC